MFKKLKPTFLLLFILTLSQMRVLAQNFLPPVTSYSSSDYDAASQNWGLSTDEDGTLYAANNEGLLRFDGQRWEVFTLPNKTIIRSVFCLGDRIYTGSYEEFGYWEKDDYGSLNYTSLSKLIKTKYANEEFWQISAWENTVIFRSFGNLYCYTGENIRTFKPQEIITALNVVDRRLLLGTNSGGILEFDGGVFKPITTSKLNQTSIIELVTYKDFNLAGTRTQGIFSLKNGSLEPWGSDALTRFLQINELNKIEVFNDDLLIIGTVKGGIIYYNPKTQTLRNHYRQNGLQNNTVLSLHKDQRKIWIGLDNGIDVIIPDAPIQYLLDNTGQLGAVYDIASFKGELYVGSNTGVHKITDTGIYFIPGSQGQVWSFTEIEERLFVNHNLGLYELKGNQLERVTGPSGSYSLTSIPETNLFLNNTYNGLKYFNPNANALNDAPIAETDGAPVEHVIFEDKKYFWAAHPYKGFYRAQLDNTNTKLLNKESFNKTADLVASKTKIHKIEGEIAFYNAGNWYRYNSINDNLENFTDLKNYQSYALINNQNNKYWFKNQNGNGLVYTNFINDSIYVYEPLLEDRVIKNYEKVIERNDSIYFITLNEGFGRINLQELHKNTKQTNSQQPLLNRLQTSAAILKLNDTSYEIPFNEASRVRFDIAAPALHKPMFYYTLSNGMNAYFSGALEFQNLSAGNYTLKVWPLINGQKGSNPLEVEFTIKRPWYLSNLMIVIYVLSVFGIIILIGLYNKRKLNHHRKELEERLIKEQERKTQLAERNNLLQEINTKRKELANTTYLAAKRNSSLIDIKNELEDVKNSGINPKKVSTIQNKINHIIDTKDNWKVFETTFKEINDDFFHQLLEDHPTLSSKDLKLCAYLKMNLTTKEIAPLMAISVRGVEIHRYRLRKKLNLNSGKNLSKYLIKNY
ncbi:LuxR C-terminal-related transcriptional regulator [Leeuwenhoekiella sp. W20_SRS_FM14]|uniref:helix-turn-helix and ligand-binding sensor domain-containing protein n=1 Tax=Leeuwenhoekiella sp. W20_SRS_FM14 TaxID=3240270 RepID=UPI003F95A636